MVKSQSQPSSSKGLIEEEMVSSQSPSQMDLGKEAKVISPKETKVKSRPSSHKEGVKVTRQGQSSSHKEEVEVCTQSPSQRDLSKEAEVIRLSQSSSHKVLVKENRVKIGGGNQTNSQQKARVKPTTVPKVMPRIPFVQRISQEALEKKLKKMTRHEQNMLILKKFLIVSQGKRVANDGANDSANDGVFFTTSFPSRANVKRVEKMVMKMAKTLAVVSLRGWVLNGLLDFKLNIRNCHFYEAYVESSFKCVAEFILLTYDLEDLERFYNRDKLLAQYTKFYNENLSHLKEENPYKLAAEGKIKFDGFPLLREQDVAYIFQTHMFEFCRRLFLVRTMWFGLSPSERSFKESYHGRFVEMARSVLLQFVPMEDNMKLHFIEDIYACHCGRALDACYQKALSNVVRVLEAEECVEIVVSTLKKCLSFLTGDRFETLEFLCFTETYVLKCGELGKFAREVIDLVGIADARRRFLVHRYISKDHILWAVGFTGFKDFVDMLVEGIGLKHMVEEPATCPPYDVYMTARVVADFHGVEYVAIEHLMLAIIFKLSQGWLKQTLIEFNNSEWVKKFLDAVMEYREELGDLEYFHDPRFLDKKHGDDQSSDYGSDNGSDNSW